MTKVMPKISEEWKIYSINDDEQTEKLETNILKTLPHKPLFLLILFPSLEIPLFLFFNFQQSTLHSKNDPPGSLSGHTLLTPIGNCWPTFN